jgi:hypothetical protein
MPCPNCHHSKNTFGKALSGLYVSGFILGIKSISNQNDHLRVALRHNKRVFENNVSPPNIDWKRSHLNYALAGDDDPETIFSYAKDRISKAGIEKLRSNGVISIELLFSLPPNRHDQDTRDYFLDCFEWVKGEFPCEVLSFDVHLDESAPHAHALILPLVDGKLCGSKLMGGKGELYARNDRFHKAVAGKYGLSKADPLYGEDKWIAVERVKEILRADPVSRSKILDLVMGAVDCDPLPFMRELGIRPGAASKN